MVKGVMYNGYIYMVNGIIPNKSVSGAKQKETQNGRITEKLELASVKVNTR